MGVSGFIFLRLLCPAILNPRSFNLLSEPPPPAAARSLVMIAKCLQNLANLVEFGAKESYMEVVNPFSDDHFSNSIFHPFQSVREKPYPDEERVKGDPARDLAIVHRLCETSLGDLQSFARSVPELKTLVTVTEMLSKHKQKYAEMISSNNSTSTINSTNLSALSISAI